MQRLLAIDGLPSRLEMARFGLPKDIEDMRERMKRTKEGSIEILTLGVGDNLIVINDQKDLATDADTENAKIINIMKTDEDENNYAHLAKHSTTHSIKPDTSVFELTRQLKIEDINSEDHKESDSGGDNKNIMEQFNKPRPRAMRSRMDHSIPKHKNSVSIWERSSPSRKKENPRISHQRGSVILTSDPYNDINNVLDL